MGKFIEEFYYGNIDPQVRSIKQNKSRAETNGSVDAQ